MFGKPKAPKAPTPAQFEEAVRPRVESYTEKWERERAEREAEWEQFKATHVPVPRRYRVRADGTGEAWIEYCDYEPADKWEKLQDYDAHLKKIEEMRANGSRDYPSIKYAPVMKFPTAREAADYIANLEDGKRKRADVRTAYVLDPPEYKPVPAAEVGGDA